ncbi:MAG: ADP-ribosylglycohydrolase family protein [Planctomycetota bacterium]
MERYEGALLGLACGDAVGTTLEFRERGTFEPLTDMLGGGPFGLQPGEWTDDTSMALCLAESLAIHGGFQAHDQMERYCRWRDEGYLSSTGRCFDIGNTVAGALGRFRDGGEPYSGSTHPRSAGNGSLMRLAPVVLWYDPDRELALRYAALSSKTTHGATEAVDACRYFAAVLLTALEGASKERVLATPPPDDLAPAIEAIAAGSYRDKDVSGIESSGYVVHTLEAALWCFHRTDSYRDAVLAASNLGGDADTTAAVCGQIAGAHYGAAGIPKEWKARIVLRGRIEQLAGAMRGGG